MTQSRTISWTGLVAHADPDHGRDARINCEFEFSGVQGGNPKTHEGSLRLFEGDYQERGAYGLGGDAPAVQWSPNAASRTVSWTALVAQADPEHGRAARVNREYAFTGVRGGNPKTHDGEVRFFEGDYQRRGAYAPETVDETGLTWNGVPITWNGEQLDWDE